MEIPLFRPKIVVSMLLYQSACVCEHMQTDTTVLFFSVLNRNVSQKWGEDRQQWATQSQGTETFQTVWPWRHAGFFIWFSLQSAARDLKRASQASNECSSEIQQKEKHAWVREWQHPADAKGGSQSLLLLTYATLNNAPFQMVDPVNPRLPLAPHSQHARSACGTELESPSLAQTAWQDTTDTDMSYNLGWINHYSNNIRGTKKTKVSQSLLHNKNVNVAFIAVWEWQKTFFIFSDNDVYILDT